MSSTQRRRPLFRRLIGPTLFIAAIAFIAVAGRCIYAFRDRNPDYSISLNIDGHTAAADPHAFLQAGFGRVKITPDISNPNAPVWLAGFSNHRAATAVHDDLWAVALVLDDGFTRLGIVALDAIGFFHDDVIAVRQ